MPGFWSRALDGAPREGEWKGDPAHKNWQRYHDSRDFTPYVRIGEHVYWDLAYAGSGPRGSELDALDGIVLQDISGWLEVTKFDIRMGWPRKDPGIAISATIDLDALAQFELDDANPDHLQLKITGYNLPMYTAGKIHSGWSGALSMSLIFRREYKRALDDLRDYLERACRRSLAGPPVSTGKQPPWPSAGPGGRHPEPHASEESHQAASAGEPGGRPCDAAPGSLPAGQPEHHRDRPGGKGPEDKPENPDAARGMRPTLPTLTVSAETAPDTDDWLSFAATSVGVLIGDGGTSSDVTGADGHDSPITAHSAVNGGSGHG